MPSWFDSFLLRQARQRHLRDLQQGGLSLPQVLLMAERYGPLRQPLAPVEPPPPAVD